VMLQDNRERVSRVERKGRRHREVSLLTVAPNDRDATLHRIQEDGPYLVLTPLGVGLYLIHLMPLICQCRVIYHGLPLVLRVANGQNLCHCWLLSLRAIQRIAQKADRLSIASAFTKPLSF